MVKINHKSKRVPAKRRYTVEKRIRSHNKKQRKENKKNPNKQKRNKMKNFHIPNKFPSKNEILNQVEELKNQRQKEKQTRKLEARQNKKLNTTAKTIEELKENAEKDQETFDNATHEVTNDQPMNEDNVETSAKSFYKEFKKIIELADIIIEVIDARDPLGTRCRQVEQLIHSSGPSKRLILLLNKIDLVPKENIQKWLKYLRSEYPTVAFKSSTQNQKEKLSQIKTPIDIANDKLLSSSKCLGADILMKLLKNYCRNNNVKQIITVGVIGLPNTGKSSLINSLKRSHACQIGAIPGLTKHVQEVKLDKNIKLLDSPGIVMSKDGDLASLVLKNCVNVERLEDPIPPVDLIIKKCKRDNLMLHYNVEQFNDVMEFLSLLAIRSGRLKKGGIPDITKAAKQVINDWNNGKLPYYTVPPEETRVIDTQFINEMSKSFDIDSILAEEQNLLRSMNDSRVEVHGMEVEPSEPEDTELKEESI